MPRADGLDVDADRAVGVGRDPDRFETAPPVSNRHVPGLEGDRAARLDDERDGLGSAAPARPHHVPSREAAERKVPPPLGAGERGQTGTLFVGEHAWVDRTMPRDGLDV